MRQIRRSIIRHFLITLVLAAATTEARADLIGYIMTGTITSTSSTSSFPGRSFPLPVAIGDHLTWTLQYDRNAPASGGGPGWNSYTSNSPVITNIVDQTNGNRLDYYPPWSPSVLTLSRSVSGSSFQAQFSSYGVDSGYSFELNLRFNGPISTSQLASLQLNSLPRNEATSSFQYNAFVIGNTFSYTASVDSMSDPVTGVPEPGSFTLLLLGAAGLTVRRLRLRF